MAKGNRRFGAADQAVVVRALLDGATVKAAAKAAGFCVQTLHNERARNALFAEAWAGAVEESGRPMLVAGRGGRRWQVQRARRNRFTRERKDVFLAHFSATCDAEAAAEKAEVSISTVYDHRRTDPAFAEGCREAIAEAYARLEAEALRQRLAAMERFRVVPDETATPELRQRVAEEFERAVCLLREYRRSLSGTRRGGPVPAKWSFEAAFEALEKELRVFGARAEQGDVPESDHDEA
jgi:hypothetical protein